MIPPFDTNTGVLTVVDFPRDTKPKFGDKILIGETHTAVDLTHAGGDAGDLEAADAEREEEAIDDKTTAFATHPVPCEHSILLDERGHVCDEYRTMIECPYCEQGALSSAPIEFCTRRLQYFKLPCIPQEYCILRLTAKFSGESSQIGELALSIDHS